MMCLDRLQQRTGGCPDYSRLLWLADVIAQEYANMPLDVHVEQHRAIRGE